MWDLAWKNLWVRKLRSVLTILGVGVALELVILLTTILDFTERDLQGEFAKYAGQMYVRSQSTAGLAGQEFPPINSTLTEEEARQIVQEEKGEIDEARSTLVVFRGLAPPPYPNAPPQALAVGVEPEKIRAYLGDQASTQEGTLSFSGPEAREAILGPLAGSFFGRPRIGDTITVAGEPLLVIGLLAGEGLGDRVTGPAVLIPLRTAQAVFNHSGTVSAVLMTASRVSDVAALAKRIQEKHPKLSVLTQEEMAKNLEAVLVGQRIFFDLINNTAYAVAAIVVLIVMVMSVTERTREIGTLRAIGASRWLVLRTVVLEAMFIGLTGGVLSIPIAFLLDRVIGFGLAEVVEAWNLVRIVAGATLLSMGAAFLPAWRATRIAPVEALRYE